MTGLESMGNKGEKKCVEERVIIMLVIITYDYDYKNKNEYKYK